jgi:hypothetical protein
MVMALVKTIPKVLVKNNYQRLNPRVLNPNHQQQSLTGKRPSDSP